MTGLNVHALHIYPIKGVRGVALNEALARPRGLAHDRRWLIVDADGKFITQRSHAKLAAIEAAVTGEGLRLSAPDMGGPDAGEPDAGEPDAGEMVEAHTPDGGARLKVAIWRDQVDAALAQGPVNQWLSDFLGEALQLVYLDDAAQRTTAEKWNAPAPVSFADGMPFLVTHTASLADLNQRIEKAGGAPVGMERFRPNIVLAGDAPWAEDRWARLQIGPAVIDLVKPCERCLVTTKDQKTGHTMGAEPLRTLATFRKSADARISGVLFGWNAVLHRDGVIRVGDAVRVLREREALWPLAPA